ncbi:MAG: hypothetical protein JNM18_22385 [Planctomycetaceae bacterium]|nr:hypothetical protein [Planctomycetaceae bacterium]
MTDLPARRSLLRFAQRLYDHWSSAPLAAEWPFPDHDWLELRRTVKHWQLAKQRGWRLATEQARSYVQRQIDSLIAQLTSFRATQEPDLPQRRTVALRDLYDDLRALHAEFPVVRLDHAPQELAVQTEPIVLDDEYLGPFEIVLKLPQLSARQPYRVVALEPHPADHDFTTPHPHVRDEVLCEGEGHSSIRTALRQGRLLDFFILVRQVLRTYNRGSAFIALDEWHGRSCPDCSGGMDDDNSTLCERCETAICYDCSYSCSRCGRGCCSDCHSWCGDCDRAVCHGCLESCAECEGDFCSDCLTDGRCQKCTEPNDEEYEHANDKTIAATTDARAPTDVAIQPVCLGKVALPA